MEKKFSNRKFGVELEVGSEISKFEIAKYIEVVSKRSVSISKYSKSVNNTNWHVKEDASCGLVKFQPGIEIASFVASGIGDLVEIMNVSDVLLSKNVKVNNNCGLHIHVNINDFTIEQTTVMLARWVKIENLMKNILPERRVKNKFCRFLSKRKKYKKDKLYSVSEFWNIMNPISEDLIYRSNYEEMMNRRVSLNIYNYAEAIRFPDDILSRKTVELRLPEGTLNSENISNWVKIFVNFVDSCIDKKMPNNLRALSKLDQMFEYLGLDGELSAGLKKAKEWILKRIVEFGNEKLKKTI